jgi:hypothetical protein
MLKYLLCFSFFFTNLHHANALVKEAVHWVYDHCGDLEDRPYFQHAVIDPLGNMSVTFHLNRSALWPLFERECVLF